DGCSELPHDVEQHGDVARWRGSVGHAPLRRLAARKGMPSTSRVACCDVTKQIPAPRGSRDGRLTLRIQTHDAAAECIADAHLAIVQSDVHQAGRTVLEVNTLLIRTTAAPLAEPDTQVALLLLRLL